MGAQQSNGQISTETVKDLDLNRYAGEWYEIAKYPFPYETDCDTAKAIYRLTSNQDKLLVENQCYVEDTMIRSRNAVAWIPDPSDKGKLLIEFTGSPRDPKPSSYYVHYTDYQDAIVGGPSGKVLWWLSRKPVVKAQESGPMLEKIKSFGYDVDKLVAHPSRVVR